MTPADEAIGTVVIDGFYGHGNAGDEAILASIVQQIEAIDPNAEVIVSTSDPSYTMTLHDVDGAVERYVPRSGPPSRDWLAAVRRADQFWIGGGGLFGERKLFKYALATAIARGFGTRVATVAVGSGPIDGGNRLVTPLLSHADAVTVRDEYTAETLRAAGVDRQIDVLADPVFSYDHDEPTDGLPDLVADGLGEDAIAVALRAPPGEPLDETGIAVALSDTAADLDARVVFLPFHVRRSGAPSDVSVARRVAERMGEPAIVCASELTFQQLLAAIDRADVLVGVRLHSVIFAALVATPFVGLPYAPKCESHLRKIEARTDLDCRALSAGALRDEVHRRWYDGMDPETVEAVEDCRTTARTIVPTVGSEFAACSKVRTVDLLARVGFEGASRLVSNVTS